MTNLLEESDMKEEKVSEFQGEKSIWIVIGGKVTKVFNPDWLDWLRSKIR